MRKVLGTAVFFVAVLCAVLLALLLRERSTPAGASTLGASSPALAATTPGWECVPTQAGQAVVSGGTAATPSCVSGTTAVLAPTYVSSGVAGKPTVVFSAVNVQIISGSGSTSAAVNGEGNLVVGYDEDTSGHAQTGSHNLIVGSEDGWTSYGGIIGGFSNLGTGKYATVLGGNNTAAGGYSFADGNRNKATGPYASVSGGQDNVAAGWFSSIVGGCKNVAGVASRLSGNCNTDSEAVLGGFENTASGLEATVAGGETNNAANFAASVLGGEGNTTTANCLAVPAAPIGAC